MTSVDGAGYKNPKSADKFKSIDSITEINEEQGEVKIQ